MLTTADIRAPKCAQCGAEPGAPCNDARQRTGVHLPRLLAAGGRPNVR